MECSQQEKFLIIGVKGLVGSSLAEVISPKHPFLGTCYKRLSGNCISLNIGNALEVSKVINQYKPRYVIHCANLSGGVDFCEKNPQDAEDFHYTATQSIGRACKTVGAKFVFISTECVFDGQKIEYCETDSKNPKNVYGMCKAKSEDWIIKNLSEYIIVRTMGVFGWQPETKTPNALMKLYFACRQKEEMFVPDFRFGTPTYAKDLAAAIVEMALSKESGVFHVVGQTYISRYEWLKKSADFLGWDSKCLVKTPKESSDIAFRPHKVKLLTDKFRSQFKTKLHTLEETLTIIKSEMGVEIS